METDFSALVFCFSELLLLYAGLLALAKDSQFIPRHDYARMKNPLPMPFPFGLPG